MSQLTKNLSQYWNKIQGSLFPWLEEELDPLSGYNTEYGSHWSPSFINIKHL